MKIRLVRIDVWEGLYINDVLIMEGISLDPIDVIKSISPVDFKSVFVNDDGVLDKDGYFPYRWSEKLEQLIEEKRLDRPLTE